MMYAYHATGPQMVRGIAEYGLVPQSQPGRHADEDRITADPVIFFTPSAELAAVWGPIVLRFPWPDDSHEDWYGDTVIVDGEPIRSLWYTYDHVPPDTIEVQAGPGWRPLVPR